MARLLAIGDLHGCHDSLVALLEKVQPTKDDKLLFLGDFIDRGAKVVETIDLLIELKSTYDCVFLKGNHDHMMLSGLARGGQDYQIYCINGGEQTLKQYRELSNWYGPTEGLSLLPSDHRKFFDECVWTYETDDFFFVHAGVRPKISLDKQQIHDMIWIRDDFLYVDYDWGKTIVHGHSTMTPDNADEYSKRYSNKINLDTGACYGYALTCMDVLTREKWRVEQQVGDRINHTWKGYE